MNTDALEPAARKLVQDATGSGLRELRPLSGGGNNRVFEALTDGGRFLLKAYFHHPNDPRNRLRNDYGFTRFAWDNGVRAVPRPLGADEANRLALYEFVEGRRLAPDEVTADRLDEALAFFLALNRHRDKAGDLGDASEACFSVREHCAVVARRVDRLQTIRGEEETDRAARELVARELLPRWGRVEASIFSALGADLNQTLPAAGRCVSPSDFGFHNALLEKNGRLRFLDFEYGGWDDPAKMAGDFFCQVALPAPAERFEPFIETVARGLSAPPSFLRRARFLLPLYRVKWCCIVLNEFLPVDGARRKFAREGEDPAARKVRQLELARKVCAAVEPAEDAP